MEKCEMHSALENAIREMLQKQDLTLARLGRGDVDIATLCLRVQMLEKIVYSGIGLSLLSLAGAILSLVLRHS